MLIVFFFCLLKFSRKKRKRRKPEKELGAKSRASVNNIQNFPQNLFSLCFSYMKWTLNVVSPLYKGKVEGPDLPSFIRHFPADSKGIYIHFLCIN